MNFNFRDVNNDDNKDLPVCGGREGAGDWKERSRMYKILTPPDPPHPMETWLLMMITMMMTTITLNNNNSP